MSDDQKLKAENRRLKTEITLEITQYCPWECIYCSSNAGPDGEHLSFEQIEKFLDDNVKWPPARVINISGGEPLAHPDFWKILQLAQARARYVWVYTNALTHIRFNADIIDGIECHANVILRPGSQIPIKADEVHLLKLVPQGRAKNLPQMKFHVSGNLTGSCDDCDHILLQADGKVVKGPCRKEYEED